MIDFDRGNRRRPIAGERIDEVIGQLGDGTEVRLGNQVLQFDRGWIETRRGDQISHVLCAHARAVGSNLLAGRIEDHSFEHLVPQPIGGSGARECASIQQVGEIPRAISQRGDRGHLVAHDTGLAEPLVVEEEERLVLAVVDLGDEDRTTDGAAEIVTALLVADVIEGVVRPQRLIDQVVVSRAMEAVRSRPGGVLDQAGARLAELGGIVRGLNGHFFQRVHAGLHLRLGVGGVHSVGDVLAVQLDAERVGRCAVHTHGSIRDPEHARGQNRGCQGIAHAMGARCRWADAQDRQ